MTNFLQFLEEGRDAPLYHGTSLLTATKILESGLLKGSKSTLPPFKKIEVSLSRNIKVPIHHAFHVQDYITCIVFELDQRKLSQNYKIYPYNYWQEIEG